MISKVVRMVAMVVLALGAVGVAYPVLGAEPAAVNVNVTGTWQGVNYTSQVPGHGYAKKEP